MNFKEVDSYKNLMRDAGEKNFILIYKSGTKNSDCAYGNLGKIDDVNIFLVDVNRVKDVHQKFDVHTVPTFLVLEDRISNIVKGCQSSLFYEKIIREETVSLTTSNGKKQKKVTVYSTPSCTYCNKLKQYFNKHGIRYTDINVAENIEAAREMARKSGQRGVPQTEINGQIIVGFDTQKLSKLLNIETE